MKNTIIPRVYAILRFKRINKIRIHKFTDKYQNSLFYRIESRSWSTTTYLILASDSVSFFRTVVPLLCTVFIIVVFCPCTVFSSYFIMTLSTLLLLYSTNVWAWTYECGFPSSFKVKTFYNNFSDLTFFLYLIFDILGHIIVYMPNIVHVEDNRVLK